MQTSRNQECNVTASFFKPFDFRTNISIFVHLSQHTEKPKHLAKNKEPQITSKNAQTMMSSSDATQMSNLVLPLKCNHTKIDTTKRPFPYTLPSISMQHSRLTGKLLHSFFDCRTYNPQGRSLWLATRN